MTVHVSSGIVASLPRLPADQVVVYDAFNNPIAIIVDLGDNKIMVETARPGNVKFAEMARQLGVGLTKVGNAELKEGDLVLG